MGRKLPNGVTTNFYGYIINHRVVSNSGKGYARTIPIYNSPEGLSESYSASYQQTAIPGASAPQITYSNTGARTLSFNLTIPFDYIPSGFNSIDQYLNAFKALVYPLYNKSGTIKPPHCTVSIANIKLEGVCTQCGIDRRTDRISKKGELAATVSLSFLEVLSEVNKVDSTYIADGVVEYTTSDGTVTAEDDTPSSSSGSSSSSSSLNTCEISIKGNNPVELIENDTGLKNLIDKGIWQPFGYTYTNRSIFTIKTFYGSYPGDINKIDKVSIGVKPLLYINGTSQELRTEPFNDPTLLAPGERITYFIIYVPIKDGNIYKTSMSKVLYVKIIKPSNIGG